MNNNFEFDKIVIAIACGLLLVIVSINLGNALYHPQHHPIKRGYEIEVKDTLNSSAAPKELPAILDIVKIMATSDSAKGQVIFNKCAVCHTNDRNGANKIGPNLWGIVNAPTARHTEFAYSEAMKQRGNAGVQWTQEQLYRYIYSPKKYVPGTKMAFVGIKDDIERANLIAYLNTLK